MAENSKYKKFYLSEGTNGRNFKRFVKSNAVWSAFNNWIKSAAFLETTFGYLKKNNIDLGIEIGQQSLPSLIKNK